MYACRWVDRSRQRAEYRKRDRTDARTHKKEGEGEKEREREKTEKTTSVACAHIRIIIIKPLDVVEKKKEQGKSVPDENARTFLSFSLSYRNNVSISACSSSSP